MREATYYTIRRRDGEVFCATKSYGSAGHFQGMWIIGETFWQLLAPGYYEIISVRGLAKLIHPLKYDEAHGRLELPG